jgi:hypothetical protein
MNFTHKTTAGLIASLMLVVVMGFIASVGHLVPASSPIGRAQFGLAAPVPGFQSTGVEHLSTVSWFNNKHWWKKNAPIIGGAGGGALVGGLLGGGKGAIIGGAAGGGGGYLYKRLRHDHHYHHH